MKAVIQRVSECSVKVEGKVTGSIGNGFLILLGIEKGDTGTDNSGTADFIFHISSFQSAGR